VKQLEDHGAAALVLPSLYEEEITSAQLSDFFSYDTYTESFAEAASYSPDPETAPGDDYLEHLQHVKKAVGIPVIASLNGSTPGGWLSYASLMEEAGADGLELHLYHRPAIPTPVPQRSSSRCFRYSAR
jgi:dihydroorotate dehydrogenase (fumarate)